MSDEIDALIEAMPRIQKQMQREMTRCPRCGGPLTLAIEKTDNPVKRTIRFCGPCYDLTGEA